MIFASLRHRKTEERICVCVSLEAVFRTAKSKFLYWINRDLMRFPLNMQAILWWIIYMELPPENDNAIYWWVYLTSTFIVCIWATRSCSLFGRWFHFCGHSGAPRSCVYCVFVSLLVMNNHMELPPENDDANYWWVYLTSQFKTVIVSDITRTPSALNTDGFSLPWESNPPVVHKIRVMGRHSCCAPCEPKTDAMPTRFVYLTGECLLRIKRHPGGCLCRREGPYRLNSWAN